MLWFNLFYILFCVAFVYIVVHQTFVYLFIYLFGDGFLYICSVYVFICFLFSVKPANIWLYFLYQLIIKGNTTTNRWNMTVSVDVIWHLFVLLLYHSMIKIILSLIINYQLSNIYYYNIILCLFFFRFDVACCMIMRYVLFWK